MDASVTRAVYKMEIIINDYRSNFNRVAKACLLAERFSFDAVDIQFVKQLLKMMASLEPLTQNDQDKVNDLINDCLVLLKSEYPEDYNQILCMTPERLFRELGVDFVEYDQEEFKLESNLARWKANKFNLAKFITEELLYLSKPTPKCPRLT